MKTNTIRGKIFITNLLTTIFSLMLVAIVFHAAINFYFQNQVMSQLSSLAGTTKDTFSKQADSFSSLTKDNHSLVMASHRIENSFNKNISVINAKSFIVNDKFNVLQSGKADSQDQKLENTIFNELTQSPGDNHGEKKATISYGHSKYAAILIPAPLNKFNINYIVLYTSLEQIAGLKNVIDVILLMIILVTALLSLAVSSSVSKKISGPLTSLKEHIRSLADRKFISNVNIVADDEIQELAENVNRMSEKLEAYDHAQKVFLQNASHEFRTPLMVIQSYAEGLKYGVVEDNNSATDIIIDESKRLCSLVEDLLYLSRLDTDEEMYHFKSIDFSDLIKDVTERMKILASKENIDISLQFPQKEISLNGDEEKLSRAITNIISNCLRYAKSKISIEVGITNFPNDQLVLKLSDDGPGFVPEDLENLFTRFYKGKKGKFGLGLAITKTIIDKHNGTISVENIPSGGAKFNLIFPLKNI